MKGNFAKPLMIALEMAGYSFARYAKNSHLVYECPGRPKITIPRNIEDPKLFYELRKLTELAP